MSYTLIADPNTITKDVIRSWSGTEMRFHLAGPHRQRITEVIQGLPFSEVEKLQDKIEADGNTPVPTQEDADAKAAADAAKAVADAAIAETQRLADEAAKEAAKPKKFVLDYQVTDEDGNPIGRPTHLEAATQEELQTKIVESHVQATRAFHRLKKQKLTFKNQQPVPQPTVETPSTDAELLAAMKDLKSDDPTKQLEAIRKVQKAEADKVRAEQATKDAQIAEYNRQVEVSKQFLALHGKNGLNDFNNCEANINAVADYMKEHELQWTGDNLELALHALESRLAPVVESVASVAPNPAPTATTATIVPQTPVATTAAAAAPVVQPAPAAPVQPAAATVNPTPAVPRPGVNGGFVPGEGSGSRPTGQANTKVPTLTAEQIRSWDGATMRKMMQNPQIRPQIDEFFRLRASQVKK